MSQTAASGAHCVGASPLATARSLFMCGWINPTAIGQSKRYMTLAHSADTHNVFTMGSDFTSSTSNFAAAYVETTSPSAASAQAKGAALSANAWQFFAVGYSASQVICWGPDGIKVTSNAGTAPSSIDQTILSGRPGDFTSGWTGQGAHFAGDARIPDDLEIAYLRAGGNIRWLVPARYWKLTSAQSPVIDEMGHENLTATSMTAGTSDPSLASYWTAANLSNQSYVQGTPIASIDLTTKFDQMAAAVDYTGSLRQIGSAGTATTASNSAAVSARILTLASATGFAAGGWCKVGSSAFVFILAISGTTILLGTPLTWSSGDTVTPYGSSAKTFTGLTFTGNSFGGTPAAGDVGSYSNCYFLATNNSVSTEIAPSNLFSITVSSSGSAPSFSSGPALNSTQTDGWTFGATCGQTATWHLGVYLKGSATPSAANVKAGTGTGFIAHFTQSLTATVANTLTATGLTLPFYDVYQLVTNGSGDSALNSSLALFKSAPAGKAYIPLTLKAISAITKASPASLTVTGHGRTTGDWVEIFGVGGMTQINSPAAAPTLIQCTVVDANTLTVPIDSSAYSAYTSGGSLSYGASVLNGASTALVSGDVLVGDVVTTPDGLPLSFTADGAFSIDYGPVTRRQSFTVDAYSVSSGALLGVATQYDRDISPIPPFNSQAPPAIFLPANQTITAVNLSARGSDIQGDTPSVSISGLPAGLSVSGTNPSTLIGTTAGNSFNAITVTYQNASGDQTTSSENLIVGSVTVPSLVGKNQADITAILNALYLNPLFVTQADPATVPAAASLAINQAPSANQPALPGTQVNIALSNGTSSAGISIPPVVAVSVVKATQLLAEEALNALLSYQIFVSRGFVTCSSTDLAGKVYRFFRLPSSALLEELQIINDSNPSNSTFKLGLFLPNGGAAVVPGSDGLLLPSFSADTARPYWTNFYQPSALTSTSITNLGKPLWQLLGFNQDPATLPINAGQDILYDVGLTVVIPGTTGGSIGLRIVYTRGPDRGLIAASAVR